MTVTQASIPNGDFSATPQTLKVSYAWPHKALHSNGRGNHAYRARLTKEARSLAAQVTWDAGLDPMSDVIPTHLEFCPPNKARRDKSNLNATTAKAILDGIADALGVDDVAFDPTKSVGEIVKGGAVIVTFTEIPAS